MKKMMKKMDKQQNKDQQNDKTIIIQPEKPEIVIQPEDTQKQEVQKQEIKENPQQPKNDIPAQTSQNFIEKKVLEQATDTKGLSLGFKKQQMIAYLNCFKYRTKKYPLLNQIPPILSDSYNASDFQPLSYLLDDNYSDLLLLEEQEAANMYSTIINIMRMLWLQRISIKDIRKAVVVKRIKNASKKHDFLVNVDVSQLEKENDQEKLMKDEAPQEIVNYLDSVCDKLIHSFEKKDLEKVVKEEEKVEKKEEEKAEEKQKPQYRQLLFRMKKTDDLQIDQITSDVDKQIGKCDKDQKWAKIVTQLQSSLKTSLDFLLKVLRLCFCKLIDPQIQIDNPRQFLPILDVDFPNIDVNEVCEKLGTLKCFESATDMQQIVRCLLGLRIEGQQISQKYKQISQKCAGNERLKVEVEQRMFTSVNVFLHSDTFEEYGVFVIKQDITENELLQYLQHPKQFCERIEDLVDEEIEKPKVEQDQQEQPKLGFSEQSQVAYQNCIKYQEKKYPLLFEVPPILSDSYNASDFQPLSYLLDDNTSDLLLLEEKQAANMYSTIINIMRMLWLQRISIKDIRKAFVVKRIKNASKKYDFLVNVDVSQLDKEVDQEKLMKDELNQNVITFMENVEKILRLKFNNNEQQEKEDKKEIKTLRELLFNIEDYLKAQPQVTQITSSDDMKNVGDLISKVKGFSKDCLKDENKIFELLLQVDKKDDNFWWTVCSYCFLKLIKSKSDQRIYMPVALSKQALSEQVVQQVNYFVEPYKGLNDVPDIVRCFFNADIENRAFSPKFEEIACKVLDPQLKVRVRQRLYKSLGVYYGEQETFEDLKVVVVKHPVEEEDLKAFMAKE